MTSALSTPGMGETMTWEMKDSHLPAMGETSSLPEEMRESMSEDLEIVPAMMTVLAPDFERSVGPVKFCSGPRVYCFQVSVSSRDPNSVQKFENLKDGVSNGDSRSRNSSQVEIYNRPSSLPPSHPQLQPRVLHSSADRDVCSPMRA